MGLVRAACVVLSGRISTMAQNKFIGKWPLLYRLLNASRKGRRERVSLAAADGYKTEQPACFVSISANKLAS